MSKKPSAPPDQPDQYGSFDPGSVLRGAGSGSGTVEASSAPSSRIPSIAKAGPKATSIAATSGSEIPPRATATNTVPSTVNAPLDNAAQDAAISKETAPVTADADSAHKTGDKASDGDGREGAEHIDPAARQDGGGPMPPVTTPNPTATNLPQDLFNADVLYNLATRLRYKDKGLSTRLRHGATHSVVMDGADLEKLHADYKAAKALLLPENRAPTADNESSPDPDPQSSAGAPSASPPAAKSAPAMAGPGNTTPAPPFDPRSPPDTPACNSADDDAAAAASVGPAAASAGAVALAAAAAAAAASSAGAAAHAAAASAAAAAPAAAAGAPAAPAGSAAPAAAATAVGAPAPAAPSPAGGAAATAAAAAAAGAAASLPKGTAKGAAKGNSTGGRTSTAGSSGKKTSGKPRTATKPADRAAGDDDGSFADSESNSDEDDEDEDDIPLPDGLLSSVEDVSASLEAVFEAIEHAGPRKENSARPTGAQLHALVVMEQHIRTLTEYACSRLGFSQERVLRNVADMVPSRMGNRFNLFRSFMKCTDPDYKPRRDLDDLLGCKSKYSRAEYDELYTKLRNKVGQEELDELLLAFDVQYPYGVPDPTLGDRAKSFHGSADRVEKLFRYFAGKLDIEGFFCIVGANPAFDKGELTHWFHTFHARRFLALKLFVEEAEIKTYLQTEVQNSVTNTRAAEKYVAQGRTLPLVVDLNDALGRGKKTAPVPQPRRKGRGFVEPKFNETYFDAVLEFVWDKTTTLKNCVPLLSSHNKKEYHVSLPWPRGVAPPSSGSDFCYEYTAAELEIAIIEFRRVFAEAEIPLAGGRGLPLAAAFQKLIRNGYMIYGWPPGVYIYNESRRKTNFDGLGWPSKCLLVMYILCGYIRICKAEHIPSDYLKTLPPLTVAPFRMVCITDAIPALSTIDESFHGTHRAYLDNEVVIGLHTTLVNRAIPTIVPRPNPETHAWKGVRAWNEQRRKQGLSTVDEALDVPITAAAREAVDANDDESGDDEDANEGAPEGNPKAKSKGKGKAASTSVVRKKPAPGNRASAGGASAAPKARSKKRTSAVTSDEGDGAASATERPTKKQARNRPATPNTDDERQRLRAKAMKKQSASNVNPFPQPKSRGNLRYDEHFEDTDDDESPAKVNGPTAGPSVSADGAASADANGERAAEPDENAVAPKRAPEHANAHEELGRDEERSEGNSNGKEKVIPASQSGGSPVDAVANAPAPQSPRRSQRHRGKAALPGNKEANADGEDADEQHSDEDNQRPLDPKGKARANKSDSEGGDEEGDNGDFNVEDSASDADDGEGANDRASTSRKKSNAGKKATRARARAPASSAAPAKPSGKRKRGAAADDEGEAAEPPAKRVRRTRKFTGSSRVPRTADYDFLFEERKELTNQGGIIMKIKGKEISLPQELSSNAIVINTLDAAARNQKMNPVQRAVIQYVYDVWPTTGPVNDEMNRIFNRHFNV